MRSNRRRLTSWALLLGLTLAVGFGCESVGLRSMKIYMQQQNWSKALDQGQSAVAENPADVDAWFNIAVVAAQIDSIDVMLDAAEKTSALTDSYNEDLHNIKVAKYNDFFNRGVQNFNAKKYDVAKADLETAYKIIPERPNATKVLGMIAQVGGDMEAALGYYQEALAADSSDIDLARQYSGLLANDGKRDEALAVMEATYNLYPENKDVVLTYSTLLQAEKRYRDAIGAVGTALAAAPDDAELNMQSGVLYMSESQRAEVDSAAAMQDVELAIPFFQKVLEIDSSNVDAAFNLALGYRAVGKLDMAAGPLAAIVSISPDDFQARIQLATVLLQLEQPEEAEPHLLHIVETLGEPTNPVDRRILTQAYRYLRIIYMVRGNNVSVEAQDLREEASSASRSQRAEMLERASALDKEAQDLIKKAEEMAQASQMYAQ